MKEVIANTDVWTCMHVEGNIHLVAHILSDICQGMNDQSAGITHQLLTVSSLFCS